MKITKRQLRRIIREAEGSTKKYDDDSALKGGQSRLPDGLQKSIIDKAVEDREEHEEEEREESNESFRITKRQLRRIIREEKARLEKMAESYGAPVGPEADTRLARQLIQAINSGRINAESLWDPDQVYITTGAAEGITVQVVQRGRPAGRKP